MSLLKNKAVTHKRRVMMSKLYLLLRAMERDRVGDGFSSFQVKCNRGTLVARTRANWQTLCALLQAERSFENTFRMKYPKFLFFAREINKTCRRNKKMGMLRGGTIDVDVQLAVFLRIAAGGKYQDIKIAFGISSAAVYYIFWRVLYAIDGLSFLYFRFPKEEEEISKAAEEFKSHSTHGVISRCVAVADGLFVRVASPPLNRCQYRRRLYSGHKTGYGLNAQAMYDANFKFVAFSITAYGSLHDRRAWEYSRFDLLVENLPMFYYVLGDAAYRCTNHMLTPYPGTREALGDAWDAYNYFQSQSRMHIEQAFGIMVRKWGLLWQPLRLDFKRAPRVVTVLAKLHNYCLSGDGYRRTNNLDAGAPRTDINGRLGPQFRHLNRTLRPSSLRGKTEREVIKQYIENNKLCRPDSNLERNKNGTR